MNFTMPRDVTVAALALLCLFALHNKNTGNAALTTKKYSYETREFTVPLDHFNDVHNKTFQLRYLYNETYASAGRIAYAPIFFYAGNEGDIELFAENTGFMWELAAQLKAVLVFAEHRYYGHSLPFGNETFKNVENLGYLTVEQTLEDFAALIDHLRSGRAGPVIAFGGSYGGMLAAWLRIKYPHFVEGALAASAPVWQFNGITPCDIFAKITTSIFTSSYSENCSLNIRNSWDMFKTYAATDEGRKTLNAEFKFCDGIQKPEDINQFFDYLEDVYGNLAMANYPYDNEFLAPLPAYPVRQFCLTLKDKFNGADLLKAMQKSVSVYSNFTGATKCLDYKSAFDSTLGGSGWNIQTCNQMVMPMCSFTNETMFRNKEWDFKSYSDNCFKLYKIRPKLNEIVFRYGGRNLETASNIIFSNGLLDPWSGGGVLQTSNERIVVIIVPEGAHHLDLRASNPADPMAVKEARRQETEIIKHWIASFVYYRSG